MPRSGVEWSLGALTEPRPRPWSFCPILSPQSPCQHHFWSSRRWHSSGLHLTGFGKIDPETSIFFEFNVFQLIGFFFQCWLSLWSPKPSDGTTSPTLKRKSSRGSSWRESSSKARCHSSSWWIQLEDFDLPWQQRALNMWKQSWGSTQTGRVESEYTCVVTCFAKPLKLEEWKLNLHMFVTCFAEPLRLEEWSLSLHVFVNCFEEPLKLVEWNLTYVRLWIVFAIFVKTFHK